MSIIGRFIGVDQYSSTNVPDLSGASNDAAALWALFKDTFKEIDDQLITNKAATHSEVRKAVIHSLQHATEDDIIVISFSGHGSKDHRLITYDTEPKNLGSTSILMSDLSDSFRSTSAKSVLCLLDCCFSGGAPAKVLETSPKSRNFTHIDDAFSGKGRVLLTASGWNEAAYEYPKMGHGFLTHAIIQNLTTGPSTLDIASKISEVVDQVRTEANSVGIQQNPVVFNLSEGGFKMKKLKKGKYYEETFPETSGIKISKEIEELSRFNIPQTVLDEWDSQYLKGLNKLQLSAVNDYQILDGESLLAVAPTSAGKTFIGELSAINAITDNKKTVFLFPYKALVNEKYEDFKELYGDKLDLRVIRCTGDYADQTKLFTNSKYDIAILTYEMFLSLITNNSNPLYRIGLIVIDEAQFLSDDQRGIVVELILTRLKTLRNQGINPQLIILSATIGDLNHFNEWLGIEALIQKERPVPLELGVIDRSGTFQYLDSKGEAKREQLVASSKIFQRKKNRSSQDIIIPLVKKLVNTGKKNEKILIFRNQTGAAEGCALYLARELNNDPADDVIETLPELDTSTISEKLRKALRSGVGFHNSNLKSDEKKVVENAFRRNDSNVQVLTATSTVAAGVNTPASTVIIVEHAYPWENRDYSVAEVKNMAGRAGRLGYQETGRALILAGSGSQRKTLFEKYVRSSPERIKSSFDSNEIGTWVIRLLAQTKQIKEDNISQLLINTYGGYLKSLNNPDWPQIIESEIQKIIPRLLNVDILQKQEGKLSLTLLGFACGNSSFSLGTCTKLVEILKKLDVQLNPIDLLVVTMTLPELDDFYIPIAKNTNKEKRWPRVLGNNITPNVSSLLQKNTFDFYEYYSRAKKIAIIQSWIQGTPMEEIENSFTINPYFSITPGNITNLADTARFYLQSAFDIADVAIPQKAPDPEEMERFLNQLEFGIPSDALDLIFYSQDLNRGEMLQLVSSGLNAIDKLDQTTRKNLIDLFGENRGKDLYGLFS